MAKERPLWIWPAEDKMCWLSRPWCQEGGARAFIYSIFYSTNMYLLPVMCTLYYPMQTLGCSSECDRCLFS